MEVSRHPFYVFDLDEHASRMSFVWKADIWLQHNICRDEPSPDSCTAANAIRRTARSRGGSSTLTLFSSTRLVLLSLSNCHFSQGSPSADSKCCHFRSAEEALARYVFTTPSCAPTPKISMHA
jgi:hypothetical protein